MERLISLFGYFVMIGLAWAMSSERKRFPWRIVLVGTAMQFALAALILHNPFAKYAFGYITTFFEGLLAFATSGAEFVFGTEMIKQFGDPRKSTFGVFLLLCPTIIFVSTIVAILYHLGIMKWVLKGMAYTMQKLLDVSGAEALAASANVFLGPTEAPLAVRPFIPGMTRSELNAVMVGGFASITSASYLALYQGMGIDAGHLLTASVISAPAGLLLAKVLLPETQIPSTLGRIDIPPIKPGTNLIDAITQGASEGLKLALSVAALLIAFVALLKMLDHGVGQLGLLIGFEGVNLEVLLGYAFTPLAWLMGIETQDCQTAGRLMGLKVVTNEILAYQRLANFELHGPKAEITERTYVILTYALCGFSNFAALGIQMGGLSAMAPDRQAEIAKLGFRAMLGGLLASCMTACIAGAML